MKKSKIELSWETVDGVLVDAIKHSIRDIQKFGDDPKRDNELIAAMRRVLKYYGQS